MKRLREANLVKKKKNKTSICCLQKTHFRYKDTEIESEGMEKGIPC